MNTEIGRLEDTRSKYLVTSPRCFFFQLPTNSIPASHTLILLSEEDILVAIKKYQNSLTNVIVFSYYAALFNIYYTYAML